MSVSEKYREIALEWGAEVPFIRPTEISSDESTDIEFIKHALAWLDQNEKYKPDYILHLRPTQPCREEGLIDDCFNKFIGSEYDSLRTVIPESKIQEQTSGTSGAVPVVYTSVSTSPPNLVGINLFLLNLFLPHIHTLAVMKRPRCCLNL